MQMHSDKACRVLSVRPMSCSVPLKSTVNKLLSQHFLLDKPFFIFLVFCYAFTFFLSLDPLCSKLAYK